MKEYMKMHLRLLRERQDDAKNKSHWNRCVRLEAKIQEAEHLYSEMLSKGLLE